MVQGCVETIPGTRMRRTLLVITLAGLAAGCAGTPGDDALGGRPSPAAERGEQFAQRACAGCHAIRLDDASRNGAAPPFRDLRVRSTAPMLRQRLDEISRRGHYEMPPVFVSEDEARDVAAYIESLGDRSAARRR